MDAAAPRPSLPARLRGGGMGGLEDGADPATPTRQLLARVKRRSLAGVVEGGPPRTRSSRTGSSQLAHISSGDAEEEEEEEEGSLEHSVEEQLDMALEEVESRERTIGEQQSRIEELEKALREANQGNAALQEKLSRATASANRKTGGGGLTKEAATQLEREFNSQEMILKGLQRDNESKTIEIEAMRRRTKQMGDYLMRQYGQDWEEVVFGSAKSGSLSGVASASPGMGGTGTSPANPSSAAFPPFLGTSAGLGAGADATAMQSAIAKLLGPAAAGGPTPKSKGSILGTSRLVNSIGAPASEDGRRSCSPSKKKQEGERGSDEPDSTFLSAADDSFAQSQNQSPVKRTADDGQLDHEEGGEAQVLTGYDPATILASIDAARLLIQGFERRQAMKMTELNDLVERANEGETRAKELASSWF